MKKKHENISFSRFVPMMDSMRDWLFVWLPCMGENQEKDRRAIGSLLYWLKSRLFNCHPKYFCLLPGYRHVSLMTRWRQWCLGQAFSGCRWSARWELGNWHNCCFPIRFSVWYHALRSDHISKSSSAMISILASLSEGTFCLLKHSSISPRNWNRDLPSGILVESPNVMSRSFEK